MSRLKKLVVTSCFLALLYVLSVVLGELKTISLMGGNSSALHDTIGYLLLTGLGLHMFFYRRQIKLASKQTGSMLMSLLLLVMVLLTVVSGFVISPQFGLGQMESHWRLFHHIAPKLTLLLVLAHVIVRWKKIRTAFKPNQIRTDESK